MVNAVAGGGKTSTILESMKSVPKGASVLFVAFNKSIAIELAKRAPAGVTVSTLHSLGLRACTQALNRSRVDGDKAKDIARKITGAEDHFERREWCASVIKATSLAKSCLAVTDDDIDAVIDQYGINPPEKESERVAFIADVQAVLKACREITEEVDFDDMVWLPIVLDLAVPQYDYVFVDETQDLNASQIALVLKAVKPNGNGGAGGRVIAVGDPRQCHPAGTMVSITGGARKPIEQVVPGDSVVSYHDCFRGIALQGRRVLRTAHRPYVGEMLRLRAEDGESVRVTPNHKIPTRLRARGAARWALYLMESGSTSRIGCCKLMYKQGFGPAMRARQERADRLWVLETFLDEDEARIAETVAATTFGLPEGIFYEKGALKKRLFEALGDNRAKRDACLRAYHRDPEFPLYTKADGKHLSRYVYVTQACNLIEGVNEVRTFDGTRDGGGWHVVEISRVVEACTVYSLSVEPTEGGHRLYVADNVLVHNCIYSFRGALPDAFDKVRTALGAKVLPLSVTYRCARAVVREAATLVPHLEHAPDAEEGAVAMVSEARMLAEAKAGDFVLSRINAPLLKLCLAFLRNGQRAAIQGRDVGTKLAAVVRRAKTDDVDVMLEYVAKWASLEIARLEKRGRDATGVEDMRECVFALSEGETNVSAVTAKIERLFADGDETTRITLSSTHKAKGMERDRVWMLHTTYLRRRRGAKGPSIEEQNLAYVAMTRARRELFLVGSIES
jgi:hypothetical protein